MAASISYIYLNLRTRKVAGNTTTVYHYDINEHLLMETSSGAMLGCDSTKHIVRLPYAGHDWNMASKDINFSRGSITWCWDQGYQDALRAIEHAGWLAVVSDDTGLVLHELPPLSKKQHAAER